MAKKYTEEELNNCSKDMLVTLLLNMQEQMDKMNQNMEHLIELLASSNNKLYGRSSLPENSKTTSGIDYCLNQEKYLRFFLEDGAVPLDNNSTEGAIRTFCVGKHNWKLIDTINGAESSAILYSIAETAKANNLNTFRYFEYLLTELPKHQNETDYRFLNDLLPWSDKLPEICKVPQS